MRAGSLRHRVTIQQKTVSSKDAFNADVFTWQDIATVHAAIEPLTGREFFSAQQIAADVTHRLRLRCSEMTKDLTPAMRIVRDTRVFDVQVVRNLDERNRELEVLAKEIV